MLVIFASFYRDAEQIKELKGNLKKAQAELKERSLLLDMYKTCTKETRDKVQLMAAEKKIRGDLEDCRTQIKKMSETNKEAVKKLADEDATRRIKQLEDQVFFYLFFACFYLFWLGGGVEKAGSQQQAGGGDTDHRHGGDWTGVGGHAGAELKADPAAEREGRRQLQADERANQVESNRKAGEGGEGDVHPASGHSHHPGELF